MVTTTRIAKIGKSTGSLIPKTILDQAALPADIELRVKPGRLVVQATPRSRSGWATPARRMRARGDDRLLDESPGTKLDRPSRNRGRM